MVWQGSPDMDAACILPRTLRTAIDHLLGHKELIRWLVSRLISPIGGGSL